MERQIWSQIRLNTWICWNEFDKIPLHWTQIEFSRLVYCRQHLDGQRFIASVVLPIIWSWRWWNGRNLVQLTRWKNLNTNVRNISPNGLQYATFSTKQGILAVSTSELWNNFNFLCYITFKQNLNQVLIIL